MADTAQLLGRAHAARSGSTEDFRNYIDGQWSAGETGETIDNVSPADTSDIVGRFPASSAKDADAAVRAATAAFASWKKTSVSARAKILNAAADYLDANVDHFAAELTREMGKALNLSKDEILVIRRGRAAT